MSRAGPATNLTVCLNPWRWEDGNQTYADIVAGENADGWSVYLRRDPATPHLPFQVDIDEDFDTEEAAREYANQLAAEHACPINEY